MILSLAILIQHRLVWQTDGRTDRQKDTQPQHNTALVYIARQNFSLFAWFKYGIIYQTKLYQLPVTAFLNPS